ncbi:MAG TPA: redoxin domain-containing protein, partial [Usitatibacter sp.]|nr:redoxin domain-containing protein [Usitatibacter sp.]
MSEGIAYERLRDFIVRAFEKAGIIVLGISFDDVAGNAAFAAKNHFPFSLLCDTDRKIGLAYGACSDVKAGYPMRISYLIDE